MWKTSFMMVVLAVLALAAGITACSKKQEAPSGQGGTSINWMGYTDGMKKAKETGKPVLVDYYTTWCKYCKMMDEETYSDPGVIEIVNKDFVAIKVDAEGSAAVENNGKQMTESELARSNKITGYPTIMFYDEKGELIGPIPGYSAPADFKPVLTFITSGAYAKGTKFSDYLTSLKNTK